MPSAACFRLVQVLAVSAGPMLQVVLQQPTARWSVLAFIFTALQLHLSEV